jgi:hypothetical protein
MADEVVDVSVQTVRGDKKFKASPAKTGKMVAGQTVEWRVAGTFKRTRLVFPDAEKVFGAGTPVVTEFSGSLTFKVAAVPVSGNYIYTIFAEENGGQNWQAEGDSPPEVIIK